VSDKLNPPVVAVASSAARGKPIHRPIAVSMGFHWIIIVFLWSGKWRRDGKYTTILQENSAFAEAQTHTQTYTHNNNKTTTTQRFVLLSAAWRVIIFWRCLSVYLYVIKHNCRNPVPDWNCTSGRRNILRKYILSSYVKVIGWRSRTH